MKSQPTQPPEAEWDFIQELQAPLWTCHHWKPRVAMQNEAQLSNGVFVVKAFPDTTGVLDTAYDDLNDFLRAGDVGVKSTFDKSTFVIETQITKTELAESYRIEIHENTALLLAADSEGIRRAIFQIQEEMLRLSGPFLPLGVIARKPVVRTRISRCFFGPINRPPKNRDELADDVDYYPDQYLNRLAHHGVNGLWLTIKFSDLCPSRFFPEHGKDAARRLEKLRKTVAQCARYGIKIYAFCIEPSASAFSAVDDDLSSPTTLEKFPQLAGHQSGSLTYFCTSSAEGQEYLEGCTNHLFASVPGLGGLIDINLGERPTHCYSGAVFFENNCPRCSHRSVASVFADTTSALQRGMHRANPEAEMVSWLYNPGWRSISEEQNAAIQQVMTEIAAAVPAKVLLQVNFESLGVISQWSRDHLVLDYSLSWVGPSDVFSSCTEAINAGARISAKLQVGNSHEVATVPFVPVPGILYRKYQKMRELGVSSAMQCWYFGNYPSPMTEAAGQLSFDLLPENEAEYLEKLAATHWGKDASVMTAAWQHFTKAYEQFPATVSFSYYGPVHDSICWPLHLIPVDEPIQPSWLLKPTPSGDRVGECFGYEFTQDEIIETCRRMDSEWAKGVQLLEKIKPQYKDQREHWTEIGVAQALGLQFRSAWNVMRFYALRDHLPFAPRDQQLENLEIMREIVLEEIDNSEQLAQLAKQDSRLGFHSEAEGYKYSPALLAWRVGQLQTLLAEDFPAVQQQIKKGKELFPEFFGTNPQGAIYHAKWKANIQKPQWKVLLSEPCEQHTGDDHAPWENHQTSWKATADDKNLYIKIDCQNLIRKTEQVIVTIESRRCWPAQRFIIDVNGRKPHESRSPLNVAYWDAEVREMQTGWEAELTISWNCFLDNYVARRPIRINVSRSIPDVGTLSWQAHQPAPNRLIYGDDNSADYGWVVF